MSPRRRTHHAARHRRPPSTEVARYQAPRATVDPDTTKTWLRRAMPILRAHRGIFITSLVLSFVGLVLQVQIPDLLNHAIDNSVQHHTVPLHFYVWWVLGLGIAGGLAGYVSRLFLFETAYEIEYDLRNIIYEHLTRMSFPFYDRVQSGQLISRANSDIRSVQMYMTFAPMILVQCSIALVAFGFMLSINVLLAFVAMATMPFVFLVGHAMRKSMFPVSWLIQARLADVATIVDENVNGVRVVRSFAAEKEQLRTLAKAADKVQWGYVKDADLRARWTPAVQNLPQVGLALVLGFGGYMVIHGTLGLGAILAFNFYLLMLQAPFMMLGMIIMMGQRAAASAERIYEILDEQPTIVDRPGAVDLVDCKGDVRFEKVGFSYGPDLPMVLSDLDLHLRPGETVALVGRTGSGKSTVARLIPRFYDVTAGQVRRGRPRRPGPDAREPAGQRRRRARRRLLVLGVHPGQHRLRASRRRHRRRGGRGARRGRRHLHPGAAPGIRHRGGRAGLHALGGPAPAHHHRPDPARQPAHPRPRRRHQRHRRAGGAADPRRPARAHGRAHHADRGAPAVDDQPGRPRRPARGRAHRGRRHPRRAARDHPALRRGPGPGGPRCGGRARGGATHNGSEPGHGGN